MTKLYKLLRKHGFEFGYSQRDHMFVRGWIGAFIRFNVPEEEREEMLHYMGKMKDEDFPKMVDKFIDEYYG